MSTRRFSGVRRLLRIRDVERDLDEELAFHRERTVEELMAGGLGEREAREEARRRFGDERRWRRELVRLDRGALALRRWAERIQAFGEDVRYAVRRMRRSPGLTAGVVLTFALGIGANATMFGILDRLLLRPPAHVVEADAVRRITIDRVGSTGTRDVSEWLSYPDYLDLTRASAFSSVAAYSGMGLPVERDAARQLAGELVTGNFFSLLGVRPALGRFFGPAEDRPYASGVAVISHGLWRRDFGGDPGVLGRTIDFGKGPYTIIGVAPEGFTGVDLDPVDVWLPLHTAGTAFRGEAWREGRSWYWMHAVGRLAAGVTPDRAAAEATALHRAGRRELIEAGRYDPDAAVLAAPLIVARGPRASEESVVAKWLAGVSLLVLLIACANVANLLLARAMAQRREFGVRLALGIPRRRLLAQTVTESLLLAAAGAAAALLVARWAGTFVRRVLLPDVAWIDSPVGGRVVLFSLGLSAVAGLAAGLFPAVQSSRRDVLEALKAGSRTIAHPGSRVRDALAVLQAALSVVLLVGAGLFVRSFHGAATLDLGFDPDGVLVISPIFDGEPTDAERAAFFRDAAARLPALPGVERAVATTGLPFWGVLVTDLRVPGLDSIPALPTGGPYIYAAGPGYFPLMRLRFVRGRSFQPEDHEGAVRVAVVNETMARQLWPGGEALGRCLIIAGGPCAEVVGVVEDTHVDRIVEEPTPQYYVPLAQSPFDAPPQALLVRVRGDPAVMIPAVQGTLLALEPRLRFAEVRGLREAIDPQARSWRLGATMFSLFGALALVVAAIGVYSVLAFSVAQRMQELGIRSALGAGRGRLVGLVLGHAARVVGVGVAFGLAAALLAGPHVEPLLFQTSSRDSLTLGAVAVALFTVALLASGLPAWRATRVDPNLALRVE